MSVNGASEAELVDAAVALLGKVLPPRWRIERHVGDDGDILLSLLDANSTGWSVLVVSSLRATPAWLEQTVSSPLARRLRRAGNTMMLVVAPYLSPRSRQLLDREELNYLDLTGNVRLTADYPAVFVRTIGAQRDPTPRARADRGLGGAATGQVVRVLVDVAPPYRGAQIASVAGVSAGHCSRVLRVLEEEALIVRTARGLVTDVHWSELLQRRADAAGTLFDPDRTKGYVARNGAAQVLADLARVERACAVTGSFAAANLAPVTAPHGLVLYTADRNAVATELGLLPSDEGADVRLIIPPALGVLDRATVDDTGIWWVAPSQVVIDCLTGTGRMPDEADAVLAWMSDHQDAWRVPSIDTIQSHG